MCQIVTHHGFNFGVDTMDWGHNSADGERAAWLLMEWLQGLDPAKTAQLHAELSSKYCEGPMVDAMFDAGVEAIVEVTRNWYSPPNTGHNCSLYVPR